MAGGADQGQSQEWQAGATYSTGNIVSGSDYGVYISSVDNNRGHDPTTDGGVHWQSVVGGGVSFATPAITLDAAAAAGSAGTVIRSDSVIAAFDDGDTPVTAAFGGSPDTGSSSFASRDDHDHGLPAAPSGGYTATALQTSAYNASWGDLVPTDASGGDFNVTLPAPANGGSMILKNVGVSGSVTLLPNAAEKIDGADSLVVSVQWQSITINSNGTDSYIT